MRITQRTEIVPSLQDKWVPAGMGQFRYGYGVGVNEFERKALASFLV